MKCQPQNNRGGAGAFGRPFVRTSYEPETLKRVLAALELFPSEAPLANASGTEELRLMIRTAIRVRRPLLTARQSPDDLVLTQFRPGWWRPRSRDSSRCSPSEAATQAGRLSIRHIFYDV